MLFVIFLLLASQKSSLQIVPRRSLQMENRLYNRHVQIFTIISISFASHHGHMQQIGFFIFNYYQFLNY